MFLQDTRGRRADALSLERMDVHWDANMVRFDKTKTDLPRSIPMTNRVREFVTRRLANPKVSKVFPWDPNTGKRTDQPANVRAKPRRNRDGSALGIYPILAGHRKALGDLQRHTTSSTQKWRMSRRD